MIMWLEHELATQQNIQKYVSNRKMHVNIHDAYYSRYLRYSHQHVLAGIMVFFNGDVIVTIMQLPLTMSPSLRNN